MQENKRVVVLMLALVAAGGFEVGRADALSLAGGAEDFASVGEEKTAVYTFKCRDQCGYHLRPGHGVEGWQGRSASTALQPKLATAPALQSLGKRLTACPSPPRHPVMFLDENPRLPVSPESPRPTGLAPSSPVRIIPLGGRQTPPPTAMPVSPVPGLFVRPIGDPGTKEVR
jgi:hypothetical protein